MNKLPKYYVVKDLFRDWFLKEGKPCDGVRCFTMQPHVKEYPFFSKDIAKFKTKAEAEEAINDRHAPSGVVFQIVEVIGLAY